MTSLDALMAVGGKAPALFARDAVALLGSSDSERLAGALGRVSERDIASLPLPARVALQNDLWGLLQRLERVESSSARREALLGATRAMMARLAPTAEEAESVSMRSADALVRSLLPADAGWTERGSELPVLSHERLFGLRRIFRVFERPGQRALVSHLLVITRDGHPRMTSVVGEVEVLALGEGQPRGERLLHLDRRQLRCGGPERGLVRVDEVSHVPGLGADGFLLEFDTPIPLTSNPCARCHEDSSAMSLPSAAVDPREREKRLLEQVAGTLASRW
ncbi:MAG: hypothetical protein L0Y66_11800 [Myxococcaceae bacterium]|nr:hypothetical protein [Myxococcaceae bacterium]